MKKLNRIEALKAIRRIFRRVAKTGNAYNTAGMCFQAVALYHTQKITHRTFTRVLRDIKAMNPYPGTGNLFYWNFTKEGAVKRAEAITNYLKTI